MGRSGRKEPRKLEDEGLSSGLRLSGWGLLLVVVFCAVAPCLAWIELADEGVTAQGALRIAQGQIPHRDFFALIPPLSFALLALPLKLFGPSVLVVRLTGLVVGILLAFLTKRLADRLMPDSPFAWFPVAVLAMAGTGAWPFPSHHWVGNLLVTAAVLAGLRAGEEERPARWAMLSGALSGLAVLALQDLGGLFVLLAAALWLPRLPVERRWATAKAWVVGLAVGGGAPFLLLLLWAGPTVVFSDLVLYPLKTYWAISGNRVGVSQPMLEILSQWSSGLWKATPLFGIAASVAALVLFLLPFLSPLPAVFFRKRPAAEFAPAGLLAAGALAFALTASRRWGPINLIWGASLPAVGTAWLLASWHQRASGRAKLVPAAIALVTGGACLWAGLAVAGRALDSKRRFPVQAVAGTLYEFNAPLGRDLQELLVAIESWVPQEAPILCCELPLINFLSRRPNPSRYDLFSPPNTTTLAQTTQALEQMEKEQWPWVVVPAMDLHPDQPFDRYLMDHYKVVWSNARFGLCERIGRETRSY